MFKESADTYINESLQKMDATDKKLLAKFIAIQAAYKRAKQMKGTVKSNSISMSEVVAIVRKLRKEHAGNKE